MMELELSTFVLILTRTGLDGDDVKLGDVPAAVDLSGGDAGAGAVPTKTT